VPVSSPFSLMETDYGTASQASQRAGRGTGAAEVVQED
jgi:hypothetical protein